jgi:hypothetical protein
MPCPKIKNHPGTAFDSRDGFSKLMKWFTLLPVPFEPCDETFLRSAFQNGRHSKHGPSDLIDSFIAADVNCCQLLSRFRSVTILEVIFG